MEQHKELIQEEKKINKALTKFRKKSGDFARKFLDAWREANSTRYLSAKERELITLAVVLNKLCIPCIFKHVKLALQSGATPEEIIEAANLACALGGGIVYEYTAYVIEALELYAGEE